MLRRTIRWLPLLGVALSLLASHALGQGDPLALQQQAIRRIDGFIEAFRKTGDMRSRIPDLAQAERELAASNQALAARGDWDALALGLIKQGHTQRMQSNWAPAIGLYSQAGEAARRAGNVVHQADALGVFPGDPNGVGAPDGQVPGVEADRHRRSRDVLSAGIGTRPRSSPRRT